MVRFAPPIKLPSAGMSLGELTSDIFQTGLPSRKSRSSFWEVGNLIQKAKNLFMVISPPLLLVISVPISFGLGFDRAPNVIDGPQSGSVGAEGVFVGVGVGVAVKVGVKVRVGVRVGGTGVRVTVGTMVGVSVGGPAEGVHEGRTKPVLVGGKVGEGMGVLVSVVGGVGVKVISLCIRPCASPGETGVISLCEQNWPVIVQAMLSSS